MKKFLILVVILLCLSIIQTPAGTKPFNLNAGQLAAADSIKKNIDFGKIPLYFIPNNGQFNDKAKFYSRTSQYTLWLTKQSLVFDSIRHNIDAEDTDTLTRAISRLYFLNANPNPEMTACQPSKYKVNYLKGKSLSQYLKNIDTSTSVVYKSLYNNIDLKIYGIEKQIEYDWIVKPGGDPANICVQYQDVKSTRLDENGNIIIATQVGEFAHKHPVSYQNIPSADGTNKWVPVRSEFVKIGENTYGLEVGSYDTNFELIIDPVVLTYSTYLGGNKDDHFFSLAVDSSGCAYAAGDTYSTDFPTNSAYQGSFNGGDRDVCITKFSANGTSLLYSTYLGGSGIESAEGIQVGTNGAAYIVGLTSSTDFPTLAGYQTNYGGGTRDAFVTKLSTDGSNLVYSTYLGGSDIEQGFAIARDSSDNVYITGRTYSSNFPTHNAYQNTFGGGDFDAFVASFSACGCTLNYSTYLGGSGNECGYGIAIYGSNACVTGRTSSTDFPTFNEYQDQYGGGDYDVFVSQFSSSGQSLVYSTYIGGSGIDTGYGIAVSSNGTAYMTGTTTSNNYPNVSAYQSSFGGVQDAFVSALSPSGTSMTFSTYLGGGETDGGAHIALDGNSNVYVTGSTQSTNFPLNGAYQTTYNGGGDAFVSVLNSSGSTLTFSTYLGGGGNDSGKGIVPGNSGYIYVAGHSDSTDFPTSNAYQNTLKGSMDGFVAQINTTGFGTLCGAVDNCDLTWTTGGGADWFCQDTTYYYDGDAAQSGGINHSQSSLMQTTVTGPGELSFWWKVDSEECCDFLTFTVDGSEVTRISGTGGGWTQVNHTIASGTHSLEWAYSKDASIDSTYDCGWLDKVEFTPNASLAVNRSGFVFGTVGGATTSDQVFYVTLGHNMAWTVDYNSSWLTCSPTSGNGNGVVTVSVNPTGLAVGTYNDTITITAPGADDSPQTIPVSLHVFASGSSDVPFGYYSTPGDGSTIRSNVPFTGWVLDDIGIESVKIYRQSGSTQVYIGDAVLVDDARPDVEILYPHIPFNYRAGWGYMMLTNYLPNGGNGTFVITAVATDIEGHQVTLGSKTVFVDNANAVKPFGTIDTPSQGGAAFGNTYINWGWALTPQPNTIPKDGSTIQVWVDGVSLGNPHYNIYRADIAQLFPGYNNTNGAVGYYVLDTTTYSNGVHNISWSVRDNAGNVDGIGSRYFTIANTSSNQSQQSSVSGFSPIGLSGNCVLTANGRSVDAGDSYDSIGFISGYKNHDESNEMEMLQPGEKNITMVNVKQSDRFELHFDSVNKVIGRMMVGEKLKALPIGSHMDMGKGIFSWQIGAGFVGKYPLVFFLEGHDGSVQLKRVIINVESKF